MKHLFLTLVAVTLFSFKGVSQNESIQGSVYIKLIDIHNISAGWPEDIMKQLKDSINNATPDKKLTEFENEGVDYLKFLVKNNFLYIPRFKLKTDKDKIINVFVEEKEYEKLKKKLKGLDREKEKINLNFEGVKMSDGFFKDLPQAIYYTNKITFVEKVKGETDWDK
jgi:hypothetical protein